MRLQYMGHFHTCPPPTPNRAVGGTVDGNNLAPLRLRDTWRPAKFQLPPFFPQGLILGWRGRHAPLRMEEILRHVTFADARRTNIEL